VLAFSPAGTILATGGHDQVVRLWDVARCKQLQPPPGHESFLGSVCFSGDGNTVASSGDGTLRLWEAASGKEIGKKGQVPRGFLLFESGFDHAAFTPDGRHLMATKDGKIHRWDLQTGKELAHLDPRLGFSAHVALAASSNVVAVAGERGKVHVGDPVTGNEIFRLPAAKTLVAALALSSDGKYLAVGSYGDPPAIRGFIALWDTTTGKRVWQFTAPTQLFGVVALTFSPDSKILVAGIQGSDIAHRATVFDVPTGKELAPFEGPISSIWSAAFSPDGKTLATGAGEAGVIRLWEVASRKIRLVLRGEQGIVRSLAFAPDGLRLASAGNDTTALVWDIAGASLKAPLSEQKLALAWTDLGADAVAAYRAIRILGANPERSIPFLKKLLTPAVGVDPQRLARLIGDLNSDRFHSRKKAAAELAGLGEAAEPGLRATLRGEVAIEARQRIERLLKALETTTLREARALEAVEHMALRGSPAAREYLRLLAAGAAHARLTREAGACLARVNRITHP
jgi:WD40 repeat protein